MPEIENGVNQEVAYWFVGALRNEADDQLPRFFSEQIWESVYSDQFSHLVRRMKAGDRIAVKASFVQKRALPFAINGKSASVMRIKATGTIVENLNDGKRVRVAWDAHAATRDWYFYTYRTAVVEAYPDDAMGRRLIDFTFHGDSQDYSWFLAQPYWVQKYGTNAQTMRDELPKGDPEFTNAIGEEQQEPKRYTVEDIVEEGCFLRAEELARILDRWRSKKNLVLQGPPGTGKTWLAKRLGFALVGSNDRETTRLRLRAVQFHPSLAYEDFVRGWRPSGEGKLSLVDGILMEAIEAAKSEPDLPFVLVVEEINRGNPAQIFGEMLTLLENTKRRASEAMELAYRRSVDERVFVPKNLHVIGTMNVADRSLAIVDLALRRRFAFVDLEPRFGPAWRTWCGTRGLDSAMLAEVETRLGELNEEIASATSLGPQFRIGHSYVTPDMDEIVSDSRAWFMAKVETEIGPLLDEYWYDSPGKAKKARAALLDRLV